MKEPKPEDMPEHHLAIKQYFTDDFINNYWPKWRTKELDGCLYRALEQRKSNNEWQAFFDEITPDSSSHNPKIDYEQKGSFSHILKITVPGYALNYENKFYLFPETEIGLEFKSKEKQLREVGESPSLLERELFLSPVSPVRALENRCAHPAIYPDGKFDNYLLSKMSMPWSDPEHPEKNIFIGFDEWYSLSRHKAGFSAGLSLAVSASINYLTKMAERVNRDFMVMPFEKSGIASVSSADEARKYIEAGKIS